jgi:hypothetical protein
MHDLHKQGVISALFIIPELLGRLVLILMHDDLPKQRVISALFISPEMLEIFTGDAGVPCHLALRTKHPGAVWALGLPYYCLVRATFIDQQCRAVLEGAVEPECPQC